MTINEIQNNVRKSLIGQWYFSHLRSFAAARWIAAQVLLAIRYSYYILHFRHLRSGPLLSLDHYDGPEKLNETTLYASEFVLTPMPRVFPETTASSIKASHDSYTFPLIKAFTLANAVVNGSSSFVGVGSHVLHQPLYDSERDFAAEEAHGLCRINAAAKKFKWMVVNKSRDPVPVAASFSDGCAANYSHWLTEILPTIAMFCAQEGNETIPLIVNANLHPNLRESLDLIAGPREVIAVAANYSVAVAHLHLLTPCGYVQFDRRNSQLDFSSHGRFSPTALALLRARLLPLTQGIATPRKIYLKRNSIYRSIVNVDAIEVLFAAMGFTFVEPEKLSFIEQVALFHNADVIIGQSGAAFANIIFCKPGAQIIILSADIPGSGYWYWQNMACATNNVVNFVLGKPVDVSNMHSNFTIDMATLENALADLAV